MSVHISWELFPDVRMRSTFGKLFRSGTDLLLFFFLLLLLGQLLQKSLRLCRFKSDRDEIWQDCSLFKYASIDGVVFFI